MILLSENKDFKYLGIPVPKETENISLEKSLFAFDYQIICDGDSIFTFGANQKPDILGVIGSGEIFLPSVKLEILGKDSGTIIGANREFAELLKSKGIQIENPIPKPEHIYSDHPDENKSMLYQNSIGYRVWQESESKTVKVVIIKVKQL